MNFLDIVDFSKEIRDKKIADALEAKLIDLSQFKELLRQSKIVEEHTLTTNLEKKQKFSENKIKPKKETKVKSEIKIKDDTKSEIETKVKSEIETKDKVKSEKETQDETKLKVETNKKLKVESGDEDPINNSDIKTISKDDEEKYLTVNQREKLPTGMKAGIIKRKKLKELSDSSSEENPIVVEPKTEEKLQIKLSTTEAFQQFSNDIRKSIQDQIKLENPTITPPILIVETSKRINELWEKTSDIDKQSLIDFYTPKETKIELSEKIDIKTKDDEKKLSLLDKQTWDILKLICEKNNLNTKGFRKTLIERIESLNLTEEILLSQIIEINTNLKNKSTEKTSQEPITKVEEPIVTVVEPIIKVEEPIIKVVQNDSDTISLISIESKKTDRKTIPKYIKTLVWNRYIGEETASSICLCCKSTKINLNHFHCGHIVSVKNGGKTEIANMKPICSNCNLAMGTTNMDDFMATFNL